MLLIAVLDDAAPRPAGATAPFVFLTTLLASVLVLILLLLGTRANVVLPRMRDWVDTHSWIVNEIVIGLFLVMTL